MLERKPINGGSDPVSLNQGHDFLQLEQTRERRLEGARREEHAAGLEQGEGRARMELGRDERGGQGKQLEGRARAIVTSHGVVMYP